MSLRTFVQILNSMKTVLFACLFFICAPFSASEVEWGKTGHRTTGEIAEIHLKNRTKRKIDQLLNDQSLALVSTFGDDIKSDPRYRKYSPWHYVNIPFGKTYAEAEKNPKGDLITGIKTCIAVLKDENSAREEKVFHLKMLVHFMGDLHQPMHFGLKEDKGGNDFQVRWFGKGSNLHRVWDSDMLNSYQMSYTELAENRAELSKEELKKMRSGSLMDWAKEAHQLTEKIYESAEIGEKLGYRYMYDWFPTVREQLQKGGVRLAKVLNEIFG